jgi:hypothetical protein
MARRYGLDAFLALLAAGLASTAVVLYERYHGHTEFFCRGQSGVPNYGPCDPPGYTPGPVNTAHVSLIAIAAAMFVITLAAFWELGQRRHRDLAASGVDGDPRGRG